MSDVYTGPVACGACAVALPPEQAGRVPCPCGADVVVLRFRPFRRRSGPRTTPVADTPCAYHAGNQATEACARCGSFLCSLCSTGLANETICPPCFEKLRASGALAVLKNRFPRPHAVALGLAFLSLIVPVLGVLLVPAVLWKCRQAIRDRQALSERESRVLPYVAGAGLLSVGTLSAFVALWIYR